MYEITRVGTYSPALGRRGRRRWPRALAAVLLVVAGALAFAYFAWPQGALGADTAGLARFSAPSFGAGAAHVSATTADGTSIPVSVRPGGVVWPQHPLAAGTLLHVDVAIKRPGWVGWLAGETQHLRLWVRAPKTDVTRQWLLVKPGTPLRLHFTRPVSAIRLSGSGSPSVRLLSRPSRTVALGGLAEAGTIGVSAVGRRWERFPQAARVTWFPAGGGPEVLATPAPGTSLDYRTPLVLQFSRPVSKIFRGKTPWPGNIPGSWHATDPHTLVFTPHGFGFGVDTPVRLRLPATVKEVGSARGPTRLISWTTPTGSQLRLQQLLSELGYLPLRWQSARSDAAPTLAAQLKAAAAPPRGTFTWRYGNTPSSLVGLWHAGQENVVSRGAIMAFESDHGLLTDGDAGRNVWQALIAATIAGKQVTGGYSYVMVHRNQSPQTLVLWHDGQTVLATPANTGIPAAPTVFGTFPVYARFTVTTMSGTNPDGTHYSDPGIPWVSYFNGGDAIHGFTRASYGSPQSLGCVELPASEAARVWPYTPIGTLVTVTS